MKKVVVFTDGASSGNPGPGGWGAILVFDEQIVELGGGEPKTTNNRMELVALVEAFGFANKYGLSSQDYIFEVYSDSSYAVNGITKWVGGWIKNNWQTTQKKPVMNQDLWEDLHLLTKEYKIDWRVLPGHSGIPGNERADKIAVGFRDGEKVGLFHGSMGDYNINVLDIRYDSALKRVKDTKRARSKAKAYSYLSLVDGILKRHMTWADTEKRVAGKPNVKFKKALDKEEEGEIVKEWGYSINDIEG